MHLRTAITVAVMHASAGIIERVQGACLTGRVHNLDASKRYAALSSGRLGRWPPTVGVRWSSRNHWHKWQRAFWPGSGSHAWGIGQTLGANKLHSNPSLNRRVLCIEFPLGAH